jgi:predicted ArsR family transcriptional regulator
VALSVEVLQALAAPATVEELARGLEVPEAHLQRELERLERRGYVRRLACGPAAPAASTGGCGWCTLRATCDATVAERWLRA